MEKIRLNQQKRQLLKKEWQHTVYNNMPMQVKEDLRLAQENYRSVREDVWDNVITPQVEKNFPMADMKILQKYSSSSGFNRFTDTDSCFYFKPQFADIGESQFQFTMDIDEYLAWSIIDDISVMSVFFSFHNSLCALVSIDFAFSNCLSISQSVSFDIIIQRE